VRTIVSTDRAPAAVGPYSQAVIGAAGRWVFTAGQLGIAPATGELVEGVEAQARQALENLKAVLEAAGSSLGRVVKVTVFLQDMGAFQKVNAVYSEFFSDEPPARSAVQVAALPLGGLVEMEAVALVDED
jgi:2-iminobutanoate/2-iminopropanoate deaminase